MAGTAAGESKAVAGTAKEQASAVVGTTAETSAVVAQTAKEQASTVAGETRRQLTTVVGEARGQVASQGNAQVEKAAQSLRGISEEINSMTSDKSGVVADLAHQASGRIDELANYLERTGPAGMLEDLKMIARRRPGAFLAGAAIAGVAAGRLTKGAQATGMLPTPPSPKTLLPGGGSPSLDESPDIFTGTAGNYAEVQPSYPEESTYGTTQQPAYSGQSTSTYSGGIASGETTAGLGTAGGAPLSGTESSGLGIPPASPTGMTNADPLLDPVNDPISDSPYGSQTGRL